MRKQKPPLNNMDQWREWFTEYYLYIISVKFKLFSKINIEQYDMFIEYISLFKRETLNSLVKFIKLYDKRLNFIKQMLLA